MLKLSYPVEPHIPPRHGLRMSYGTKTSQALGNWGPGSVWEAMPDAGAGISGTAAGLGLAGAAGVAGLAAGPLSRFWQGRDVGGAPAPDPSPQPQAQSQAQPQNARHRYNPRYRGSGAAVRRGRQPAEQPGMAQAFNQFTQAMPQQTRQWMNNTFGQGWQRSAQNMVRAGQNMWRSVPGGNWGRAAVIGAPLIAGAGMLMSRMMRNPVRHWASRNPYTVAGGAAAAGLGLGYMAG